MKIKHFSQLIRYKNVLMMVFMIILFSFISNAINYDDNFITFLLIISISSITIAGNIINDYFDVEIDKINKPDKLIISKHITKQKALVLYSYFSFFGIISSIYLSYKTTNFQVLYIVLTSTTLLFLYSKYLKKYAIIGNLVVSFLIGLSILLVSINNNFSAFKELSYYAFLAFFINFIREIVKDIEDVNGDYANGLKTLPILIGRKRTQYFISFLSCSFLLFIFYIISKVNEQILNLYLLFTVILPLLYFTYKITIIKSQKEIHKLSSLLKIVMLFGLISALIIP